MDGTGEGTDGIRLNPEEIGHSAAELLNQQSRRRLRGQPPTVASSAAAGGSIASSSDSRPLGEAFSEEAEKRRKITIGPPTGGTVNVGVAKKAAAQLIRESAIYKKLIEVEERIDLAIMRKQQDIKDALKSQSYTTPRTFRLYLFNTYRCQEKFLEDTQTLDGTTTTTTNTETTDDENHGNESQSTVSRVTDKVADGTGDVPSWSLRIQGQLLPPSAVISQDMQQKEAVAGQQTNPLDHSISPSRTPSTTQGRVELKESADSITAAPVGVNAATPQSHPQPDTPGRTDMPTPQQVPFNPSGSPGNNTAAQSRPDHSSSTMHFTEVFRKIVLELDREVYPDRNLIEWNRVEKEPPADGVELTRPGDKECKVSIFLYVDHKPDRFKASMALYNLIGVRQDTRSGIFMAVWAYIRKMKLQCADDRASIRVDSGLKTLLPATHSAVPTLKLQRLFEIVKMHMGPPDPIPIEYFVKLSGNVVDNQDCYDIQVDVPDDGLKESAHSAGIFGLSYPNSAEFMALNDKHLEALEKVAYHKKRRAFFEGFCQDPVGFINDLIMSQTKDLKVLAGDTGRHPEEERRSDFYQQQWVHEAIPRYLLRKAISDAAKTTADGPAENK